MTGNTYNNYLNEPYALNFNQMQSLHKNLLDEMQAFYSMFSFDSSLSQSRSMGQAVPAVHLTF